MAQRIDIKVGSYLQAALLSEQFNFAAGTAARENHDIQGEAADVSAVVEQAVDFLSDVGRQMADGWKFKVKRMVPYMGQVMTEFMTYDQMRKTLDKPVVGEKLGLTDVWVSDDTFSKLKDIPGYYRISPSIEDAAQMAVTIFNKFQHQFGDADELFYEKDAVTKTQPGYKIKRRPSL
jgi:hypothetical protein